MRIATLSILALATLSVSCSRSEPPPAPAPPKQAERQKTVIDEQLKAIDKAKAVQQTMDQRTKTLDDQLQSSENPPAQRDASQ